VIERWTEIEFGACPVVDLPCFPAERTRPFDALASSPSGCELARATLASHGISAAHRNVADVPFLHLGSSLDDQTEVTPELAKRPIDRATLVIDEMD
jgi:hypothetical protein